MSTQWGATSAEWDHFTLLLGLTRDLLPVLSNPRVVINPQSKLKTLGKVPSQYDRDRMAIGLAGWTSRKSTDGDIARWMREPDYGICLQTREIRALDVDVDDPERADQIFAFVEAKLARRLPMRRRSNSPKFLLGFRLFGTHVKQIIKTDRGNIEFLADGQQFIAAGTHSSGVRYEWAGGMPDDFPEIGANQFVDLWKSLTERFALTGTALTVRQGIRKHDKISEAVKADPVANYLFDNDWVLGGNRDGSLNINCPFADQHTTDSAESSTTYWPAHTGGFAQGHFKCLHAHCAARADHDFLAGVGYLAAEFAVVEADEVTAPDPAKEARRAAANAKLAHLAASFTRNKAGIILARLPNLATALSDENICGAWIAHDQFRDEILIRWKADGITRPLRDQDAVALRELLERDRKFEPIGRELMRDALRKHAMTNQIDSAIEWLSAQEWDGELRCEMFLHRYFGTDDTPYTRAVSRYLWTALAGRVMDPGCKADMVPVLISPLQGTRKTSSVEALAPTPDQFVELRLDVHDDNLARAIRGKLVGELAELRGLASRDSDAIKAWISRTHEEWVPKYAEFATKFPRRLVLLGTTNNEEFLADDTGERRWLPVPVVRGDTDAIARDRALLWAEARETWRLSGIQWQDAERLAQDEHAHFKIRDPWDELIASWLDGSEFGDEIEGKKRIEDVVRVPDVLIGALGVRAHDIDKRKEMRVAGCLRRIGLTRKTLRVGGKLQKVWISEPACNHLYGE